MPTSLRCGRIDTEAALGRATRVYPRTIRADAGPLTPCYTYYFLFQAVLPAQPLSFPHELRDHITRLRPSGSDGRASASLCTASSPVPVLTHDTLQPPTHLMLLMIFAIKAL
jgi:hypothetical protein